MRCTGRHGWPATAADKRWAPAACHPPPMHSIIPVSTALGWRHVAMATAPKIVASDAAIVRWVELFARIFPDFPTCRLRTYCAYPLQSKEDARSSFCGCMYGSGCLRWYLQPWKWLLSGCINLRSIVAFFKCLFGYCIGYINSFHEPSCVLCKTSAQFSGVQSCLPMSW